jgi:shikimate dehydrogenase
MEIRGKTRVLGIIGWPVGHSLSPPMQNAAIDALGLDYVYVPFPVAPEFLGAAVEGLRRLGVWGCNVTIPHKTAVIPFLDRITREAELAGAVNTVYRDGTLLVGHNTDGIGFLASLRQDLNRDPAGATVLLLGAGGAARGALAVLAASGAARVIIANRTLERGRALVDRFGALFGSVRFDVSSLEAGELSRCLRCADILVNTTSVGMDGTTFDGLSLGEMRPDGAVYDMVYVPAEPPLLTAAREHGLACANGAGMLAGQGEAAFALWTGHDAPRNVMKRKLFEVLSGITKP